jgi:hypothetical protein
LAVVELQRAVASADQGWPVAGCYMSLPFDILFTNIWKLNLKRIEVGGARACIKVKGTTCALPPFLFHKGFLVG